MPIDPRRLDTTVKTTRASYDAALASFERDTIQQVAEDMSGQEPNRVHAALVARISARLPSAHLDNRNLERIAASISRGTFHGWGRTALG